MTAAHGEYLVVIALANRLHDRDPVAWRRLLAVADARGVTLLSLVYARLRSLRDAVAREAFTRQVSISRAAREALWRLRTGPTGSVTERITTQVREITKHETNAPTVGGKCEPS